MIALQLRLPRQERNGGRIAFAGRKKLRFREVCAGLQGGRNDAAPWRNDAESHNARNRKKNKNKPCNETNASLNQGRPPGRPAAAHRPLG